MMDAVSQVGGITQNAKTDHVLVISGGVVTPSLKLVDMGGFLYKGELQNNILLRRGDIVYVPKNDLGTAERYFDFAIRAMGPIVSAESAIVLGGSSSHSHFRARLKLAQASNSGGRPRYDIAPP